MDLIDIEIYRQLATPIFVGGVYSIINLDNVTIP
jgi:hypothetical protein